METEKVASSLLRSAIDGYPEGIVVFAADGRVALVNAHFLELFDLSREEALGLDERALDALLAPRGARSPGAPLDGARVPPSRPLRRSTSPLPGGGRVVRFLEADEREVGTARAEQLLAIAVHDLRAPLANVRSFAALLSGGRIPGVEPRVKRAAEVIARNAERALHLLQLYFDSQRGTSGGMALDRKPVALQPLLAEAVEARRALAAEKGIVITERMPEKPLNLSLDRERAAQALNAFLENALQRTGDNGCVDVVAEERPAQVWIGFKDGGAALSPDEARLAFDRDHQILAERRLGRGFAMSVAKVVAVAHGGTAGVETRPDGATFFVTFPR